MSAECAASKSLAELIASVAVIVPMSNSRKY